MNVVLFVMMTCLQFWFLFLLSVAVSFVGWCFFWCNHSNAKTIQETLPSIACKRQTIASTTGMWVGESPPPCIEPMCKQSPHPSRRRSCLGTAGFRKSISANSQTASSSPSSMGQTQTLGTEGKGRGSLRLAMVVKPSGRLCRVRGRELPLVGPALKNFLRGNSEEGESLRLAMVLKPPRQVVPGVEAGDQPPVGPA